MYMYVTLHSFQQYKINNRSDLHIGLCVDFYGGFLLCCLKRVKLLNLLSLRKNL